ncbi:MAG: hypothetical protein JRI23_16980, partial [Deltaproteobacteria bacterium]|nr:hypothetical protein [Deltaproteobacteria bacterium]MBW2533503.1 hypothetical protein [Deltaproteobacteria bacterium]
MSTSWTRRAKRVTPALAAGIVAAALSSTAQGITRDEVMVVTRSQAFHPWRLTSANLTSSCDSGYSSWFQRTGEGDYLGVAYDWNGWTSSFEFDQDILAGHGAGSYNNYDGWP